jgi:PAS domain S-box-containing protein
VTDAAQASRYRAVFDNARHFMGVFTPAGAIVELNPPALALLGAPAASVAGRPLWEVMRWPHPAMAEPLRAAMLGAGSGSRCAAEVEVGGPGGGVVVVSAHFSPVADASGAVALVVGEAQDVTERAGAERALRASQATFAGILGIAADAIITVDATLRVVHYNQGAERIFGWTAEEVAGRPLDLLLPARHRAAHAQHVARFGEGPDVARRMGHRREVAGLRKSGEEFPAEASIARLDIPAGRLYTVVLRDISERKREERDERLLARAGAELARSLDTAATLRAVAALPVPELAAACIVDTLGADGAVGRVASADPDPARDALLRRLEALGPSSAGSSRVAAVLATGRAELAARVDDAWIDAHAPDAERGALWRALGVRSAIVAPLTARGRVLGALTLVRTAGDPYDAQDAATAEALAQRAALALDTARLFDAAHRATRSRDEVLAVVSHDLRNPVSAVSMCARVLLEDPPAEPAAARELLEAISESAAWMQRMIQDLLDVSHIEAGRLSVVRRPEPVAPIVHSALAMVELAAHENGIALSAEVPDGLPPADADAERVVQVLANLLTNAVKFTPRGGRVTVRAGRDGRELRFTVADTGPGIPAADLPRVFDRYWHAVRTARTRGSGLGLAIVKGIVEAHGGRVWAESVLGQGSTFGFTIPAVDD